MSLEEAIKLRTKKIGLAVIHLGAQIPSTTAGKVLYHQLIRSSTSIGANYRSVCRAKSTADFLNKLKIVEEESDETLFWLELLEESSLLKAAVVADLKKEVTEIISIMVASINTTRSKIQKP